MTFWKKNKDKVNKIGNFIMPVFLVIYSLRQIGMGVGWTDTGYNYGNFVYMDKMDPMWLFSTYLGNLVGNLLTKLPLGNTMLGMNLYTGLFITILALTGYVFFVKEVKLPSFLVFVSEFIAINLCWCPTALLYNYLSYTLFGAGALLLYFALQKGKHSTLCFLLAGAALGMNVFVRFPNLSNMALIVAVWYLGIVRKEKMQNVFKQTGVCILGYLLGMGLMFGMISIKYGAEEYIQGILRLLSMPSEADDYSVLSMVIQQIRNYFQNLIWLGYLFGFMLLGTIVYQILPASLKWLKNIGYVAAVFCGFYFLWAKQMFNLEYNTYLSMFQWAVMLLTGTLFVGLVTVCGKGFTEKEKSLAVINVIIILITPLGSNNHLYLAINNLFLVAPFTLWMIIRFLKWIPQVWRLKNRKISTYPLKAMLCCILFMIVWQTTRFGLEFIFEESNGVNSTKFLNTKTEKNAILKGMIMDAQRAEMIDEISAYTTEQGLKGKELILYGEIPAMSYILEMPFAISAWPDMRSYNYGIMEKDLQTIEEAAEKGERELPLILLDNKQGTYAVAGREGMEEADYEDRIIASMETDKKLKLLCDLLERQQYQVVFENDKFMLFQAAQED